MKLYRVLIRAKSASFRYPNFISSNQLSIKAVPYTTLAGLVSSVVGKEIENFEFSYTFRYLSIYEDLETIYKFEKKGNSVNNKNVVADPTFKREILYDCYLTLYLTDKKIANAFKAPHFQLLLGRSGDLARVVQIKEIEAKEVDFAYLNGTVVPFSEFKSFGEFYALPRILDTKRLVRVAKGVEMFLINDGKGKFLYKPQNLKEEFDLKNWKFDKMENKIDTKAYFDEELNTSILLRKIC